MSDEQDHDIDIVIKARYFGNGRDVPKFAANVKRELELRFGPMILDVKLKKGKTKK